MEEKIIIQPLEDSHIVDVVNLHIDNLKEGLFYRLGGELIKALHYEILNSDLGFSFIATHGDNVVGVITCSLKTEMLLKKFVKSNFSAIVKSILLKILKDPWFIKWVFQTISNKKEKGSMIMFLIVSQDMRKMGIGTSLLTKAIETFENLGGKKIFVEVNKDNPAKVFYEKLDFETELEYKIYDKTRVIYLKELN
ncbi:MAG: GNAT family N-acetyltransferase [Methanobacteriota archaeon]